MIDAFGKVFTTELQAETKTELFGPQEWRLLQNSFLWQPRSMHHCSWIHLTLNKEVQTDNFFSFLVRSLLKLSITVWFTLTFSCIQTWRRGCSNHSLLQPNDHLFMPSFIIIIIKESSIGADYFSGILYNSVLHLFFTLVCSQWPFISLLAFSHRRSTKSWLQNSFFVFVSGLLGNPL